MRDVPDKQRRPSMITKLAGAASLGCFVCFYGGFLAKYHVVGELLCSLWPHLAALSAVLLVCCVALRARRGILMNLAVVCVFGWFVWPMFRPRSSSDVGGPRVRIVSCNVLSSNRTLDKVAHEVRQTHPDVICFFEVNYRVQQALLKAFLTDYPNYMEEVRPDNFGILVMTKLNWWRPEIFYLWEDGVPSFRARVEKDGRQFDLIATHPVPPVGAVRFHNRNEHLQKLALAIGGGHYPLILCGDLNTTPFSPFMRRLLFDLRLQNSAEGRGYRPTWPVGRGVASWIKIQIDYILHDEQCVVRDYRVLGDTGSDHYPIYAELQLP